MVVDRLTKVGHFHPLKLGFYVHIVATTFVDTVDRLHDFLVGIVLDRDLIFLSTFWKRHVS